MSENTTNTSFDVTTIFNMEDDRSNFADRVMTLVTDIRTFNEETGSGASLVPQLTMISLGEYIMLLEMIRWAIIRLANTLDEITSDIQTEIENRSNAA